ncbi:uncharacterized protein LOC135559829 [Oncorhynchus nerka]|uniref:uncharacterized protein LOC135559829 n=1 Tax=Oncorhynchus nerka TaxID=8023 RepID=UPI0031B8906F
MEQCEEGYRSHQSGAICAGSTCQISSAPSQPEDPVSSLVQPGPAPRFWPPVHLPSPVRPVPPHRTRPEVRVPSPVCPVPRTRSEEHVTSPVLPVPASRIRPPVHLPSPVRPVPACSRTRPEVRVTSPVLPVPAPRTKPPVRIHSPELPVAVHSPELPATVQSFNPSVMASLNKRRSSDGLECPATGNGQGPPAKGSSPELSGTASSPAP